MRQCYVSSTTPWSTKINCFLQQFANVDTSNFYVLCKNLSFVIPRGLLAYGGVTGCRTWNVVRKCKSKVKSNPFTTTAEFFLPPSV